MEKSIGTLNEKYIHLWIKLYLEDDLSKHEVKIGNFIADIQSKIIIEIQTCKFYKLADKLKYYIQNGFKVKVVYPVSIGNRINRVDNETGVITYGKHRYTKGNRYRVFQELYGIRNLLKEPLLSFELFELDTDDYRYKTKAGRRGIKLDKEPISILNTHEFNINTGYSWFIPEELKTRDGFTSSDFAGITKCRKNTAGITLLLLYEIGIVDRVGKCGNSYLYKVLHK